jgi:hypothetical protein
MVLEELWQVHGKIMCTERNKMMLQYNCFTGKALLRPVLSHVIYYCY